MIAESFMRRTYLFLSGIKKYGFIIGIMAALIACASYYNLQEKRKSEARELQEFIDQHFRASSIKKFASAMNADFEWPFELSKGEDIQLQRLMTSDIQIAWHQNAGRIVFAGRLLDISDVGDGDTSVLLEHVGFPRFREHLRMQAICGGNASAAIRSASAEIKKSPLSPHLAITVEVLAVKKQSARDGDEKSTYLGKGICITAMPLLDWPPMSSGYQFN